MYEKGVERDWKKKHGAGMVVEKGQEATVFRDKSGRRMNIEDERRKAAEKAEQREKREGQWKKWSGGAKQEELKELAKENVAREIEKPLARYADDQDLMNYQKSIQRLNDPMANYIKVQQEKRRKKAGGMPLYKGPQPEPNRYNIKPGHRWDGVDRSNGFEKKYYRMLAKVKSLKEHEIKYLTEDM